MTAERSRLMTGFPMRYTHRQRLQVRLQQVANRMFLPIALLLMNALTLSVQAAEAPVAAADKELDKAVAQLLAIRPDIPIEAVYPSQVDGLVGVDLPDGSTIYITADGKHMIVGDMYAIGADLTNVSDQRRAVARKGVDGSGGALRHGDFSGQGRASGSNQCFYRCGLRLLSQAA